MPANERGQRLKAALRIARVAGGTALAFAFAAFLALLLVAGPTKIAARLVLPGAGLEDGLAAAQRVNEPDFVRQLAASEPGGEAEGTTQAPVTGWAGDGEIRAEYRSTQGELHLTALAPEESVARTLISQTARLLGEVPEPSARAGEIRERIAALQRALARLPVVDPDAGPARDARLAEITELERTVAAELAQARERIAAFEAGDQSAVAQMDADLRRVIDERAALAEAVTELARTLPADNPRRTLVERRLAALQATLDDARAEQLETARLGAGNLQTRLDALQEEGAALTGEAAEETTALARRAEVEADLNREQEAARALSSAPPAARLEILSVTQQAPPFLAVTALAGLGGLLAGLLACLLSKLATRRLVGAAPIGPDALASNGAEPERAATQTQSPNTVVPLPQPPEGDAPVTLSEIATVLESFPVSRILVASVGGRSKVPTSLQLARRMADAGTLVLLVDLSLGQTSARAAGVPQGLPGLREAAEEGLALSALTLSDDESGVDILPGGRDGGASVPRKGGVILTFARRAYDHVIVDCGSQPADNVLRLVDPDCAVLLAPQGSGVSEVRARQREFAGAGLANLIVLDDAPAHLSASARSPSSGSGTWPGSPRGNR